ncbi:MAG: choice-of-anchor Q domain-containing protein [bacterium]|nr:choice-of-anchor Q domain-containing protein [bacterium]
MRRTSKLIRPFVGLITVSAALILLAAQLSAQAPVTLQVSAAGTITPGMACPAPRESAVYATVGAAAACAKDGDTLDIAAGVYTENLILQRDLTLQGADAATTILDGGAVGRVLTLRGGIEVTLRGLTLRNGRAENGAGLFTLESTAILIDSVMTGNVATGRGGAIYSEAGTIMLTRSMITDNAAGSGGAIATDAGSITVNDSLIARNSAASGGGLFTASGTVKLSNTTLSGNTASDGGGLYTDSGTTSLNSVTIAANSASAGAGGVRSLRAEVKLSNTLIADNGVDCGGRMISLGYNLFQTPGGDCVVAGDVATTLTAVPALLGGLADNGGALLTHALLENSPAIDAGNPSGTGPTACTLVDGRGWERAWDEPHRCDIGAYETNALLPGNQPPLVENDYYLSGFLDPLTVDAVSGILVNDFDPDGDSISFTLKDTTSAGVLTLNPDGSFVYQPDLYFRGEDTFTYRVSDGNVWRQAEATIIISELAVKPIAPLGTVRHDYGNPVYQWITSPGASHFYLVVVNAAGQTVVNEVLTAASYCQDTVCSIDAARLRETYRLRPGRYQWYLRAWSRVALGEIAGPMTFRLQADPPGLVTPLNATETNTRRPTLNWSLQGEAVNASRFRVAVLDTEDLANNVLTVLLFDDFSRAEVCGDVDGTSCGLPVPVDLPNQTPLSAFIQSVGPGGQLNDTGPYDNGYAGPIDFTLTAPIPALPTVLAVEYGFGLPTIRWNDDAAATNFHVVIGTAGWQAFPFLQTYTRPQAGCNGTICQVQAQIALVNGSYNVAVKASGAGGDSTGGVYNNGYGVLENQPLSLPAPNVPSGGFAPLGGIATGRPAFRWNSVANAVSYRLRVQSVGSTEPLHLQWYWASDVGCPVHPAACSIVPPLTLAPGSYRWDVQAYGPGGLTGWGSPNGNAFSVGGSRPGLVTLLAPGGVVSQFSPTFRWQAVPNGDVYEIWIGNPAVTQTLHFLPYRSSEVCNGNSCSLTIANLLLENDNYLWNVRAQNPAGMGNWTPNGLAFSVDVPFPAAPNLLSPANDTVIFATNLPTLTWATVPNSQGYYLEVKNGSGALVYNQTYYSTDPVCSANACTVQLPSPVAYGLYRWRVIPGNINGAGTPSLSRKFLSLSINSQPLMIAPDDPAISRSGNWSVSAAPDAIGESVLVSSAQDALTLSFVGTQVDVVYLAAPQLGTFAVEIDGVIVQTVNANAPQPLYGQIVTAANLPPGQHTLRILVQQGQVAIDALVIDGQLVPPLLPPPTPEATAEIPASP